MKQNAWLWYLALAVGAGQYYFVSSVGSTPDENLFTAIGWSSVVAVAGGLVLFRRGRSTSGTIGWSLVLVAMVLYLLGDLVYASLEESNGFVEFPSSADWLYLAMYPVAATGFVLVRRSVAPGRDVGARLDAAVVTIAAFGTIGAVYMNGYLTDDTFGRTAQIVASAYPVLDVVLVGLAAWLVVRARPAPACLWLVAVACGALVVANAVFNVAAISFSFESGGVADLGWMSFMVLLGAAALHPSVGETLPRHDVALAERTRRSALGVGVALLAVPAAQLRWGDGDDVTTSVVTFVAAASILVLRIALSGRVESRATSTSAGPFDHVPMVDPPMPRLDATPVVSDAFEISR